MTSKYEKMVTDAYHEFYEKIGPRLGGQDGRIVTTDWDSIDRFYASCLQVAGMAQQDVHDLLALIRDRRRIEEKETALLDKHKAEDAEVH